MVGVVVAGLLVVPLVLAFFSPLLLICLALGTGVLPVTLGSEGMMVTDFGRLDVYSIRVLGLWLASILLIVSSFSRLMEYGWRFSWHVAFLLFVVTALIWSPSLIYGTRMVAKLTAPFLFLLLVMVSVSSWTALRSMERAIFFSGILAVGLSVGSAVAGYAPVSLQVGLRIPGLGPAGTSAHLAILTMLGLAAAVTRRSRLLYAIMALCFGAAVIAGFTRITIAGLFIGTAVVLWLCTPGWLRWIMPLAGVASVPALFIFSETFRRRMFKSQDGISFDMLTNDPSGVLDQIHGSGRFEHWTYVMKTFFDPNPLVGSGIGTTQHYFYTHQLGLNVIHSEYVRLLAEVGLVGVCLFVFAVVAYMVRLTRIYRSARSSEARTYALAGLGALVVYLIFMATDNAIDYVTNAGLYVFSFIAMSERARDLEVATEESPSPETDHSSVEALPDIPHRRYPILAWK